MRSTYLRYATDTWHLSLDSNNHLEQGMVTHSLFLN